MNIIRSLKGIAAIKKKPTTPAQYAREITKKGSASNWVKACIKVVKLLLQTVKGRVKDPKDINQVCEAVHATHLEYMAIMQIVNKSPKSKKWGKLKISGFWGYLENNLPTTFNYYNEWHRRKTGRDITLTEFKAKYKTGPAPTIKMIKEDPEKLAAAWIKSGMMEKKPEFLADLMALSKEEDKVHFEVFKKLLKPA